MNRVTRHEINKFFCDTINKGNGRTTSGNDSDEFYSTTMTTYSSSKQNVMVWTTQKMRSKVPPACNIEMNTIQEVREYSTPGPPTTEQNDASQTGEPSKLSDNTLHVAETSQLSVMTASGESSTYSERSPDQQQRNKLLLSVSRESTPQTSPEVARQRAARAQSEFLPRGETFMSQRRKDCGSFLFFEGRYKDVHVSRKRSNSHYQESSKPSSFTKSPTLSSTLKHVTELKRIGKEYQRGEIFFSDPSFQSSLDVFDECESRKRAMTISGSRLTKKYFKDVKRVSTDDTNIA
jgi:hypothetical protein